MLASFAILATSCNNSRDNSSSRATGWDLSGRDGGVSFKTDYEEQEAGPGLLFVEGGTFTMGRVQDDVMHDWNNTPTQQHVQSFYIDETEVTNVMYLEYLDWLKQVFPPSEERYKNIYAGALPDTLVWRNPLGFNENMVNNYLRHPAFHTYPVVGVNWIQATEFSQWRTDRVNEKRLSDKGYTSRDAYKNSSADNVFSTETYLNAPSKVYGGSDSITRGGRETDRKLRNNPDSTNVYVQRKDGELLPAYRLPTEAEWEYAALGQSSLRDYNSYRGRKKYPWDGQYTRSGDRKTIGDQRANFKQGQGDYGGIAGWSDDGADITAEVRSYEPNDYGLYDMAGNVSEWVADVYRPRVDNEYNDFNYFRGNVYTKNAITEDGKVKVLTADEVIYDTLSNGRIMARNIPGEIAQTSIGDQETYLRTQFSKSDNINFRDGDKSSSRYYGEQGDTKKDEEMYNSPDNEVTLKDGKIDRRYDDSTKRTTLIDDHVRVYKGGSWKDREYWLDPAQRRYFPQDMATDDIGFRNAMSKVGSKSNKGRRTRN
ncbi:gliding motility lipoprotein, FGE sulfatase superfamily GldJ [Psychroflexus gondwanensis ACAM 44]|uniref:Gliding motility lipoprotein, FGE sulfatase superfamily GldJ n=2 Tax=Psychroflexus gondwanensis TaxID=251 RepID=N1WUE9_9FLAO|nr:gliding motility lipoprotein, FGE sulfatase superfamily GldJ [Psychroflexus gondwanensis ACAM 44]